MIPQNRTVTYVENKKVKNMRIFIAVLYFLQFMNTLFFPFAVVAQRSGNTLKAHYIWASDCTVQLFSSQGLLDFGLNAIFSVFVIIPVICFLVFLLDKKTNIKSFISIVACLVCAYLITFEINQMIYYGAIFALVLYVIIMFCTTILMLSTSSYNREFYSKN